MKGGQQASLFYAVRMALLIPQSHCLAGQGAARYTGLQVHPALSIMLEEFLMRTLIVFYREYSRIHAPTLVASQNKLVDRFSAEGHDVRIHMHPESAFVRQINVARVMGPPHSMLLPDMLANTLRKAQEEGCHNIVFDLRMCDDVAPQELWHMFLLSQIRPQGWLRSEFLATIPLPRIVALTDVTALWDFNDQPALYRVLPKLFASLKPQQLEVA